MERPGCHSQGARFRSDRQPGQPGEDVKECYFYLDATPSHSWLHYLYKYPQSAFPYTRLVEENAGRSRGNRRLA